MESVIRTGGASVTANSALCEFYAGYLEVDVFDANELCIRNVPFPKCTKFTELDGESLKFDNPEKLELDNTLFRPVVNYDRVLYSISNLKLEAMSVAENMLSCRLELQGFGVECDSNIELSAEIMAEYTPVTAMNVLLHLGPVPMRFAPHYLPLIGCPSLTKNAKLANVLDIYGEPHDTGGGKTKFGLIPHWIRYTFPEFLLRFQHDGGILESFTVMKQHF